MNAIIQKCVDELAKDEPRLDYMRGMLETLLCMNPIPQTPAQKQVQANLVMKDQEPLAPMDEAAILDAKARAAIDTIKAISDKSVEEA